MVDSDEYQRWRSEGDRALRSADLQANAGLHNWACFSAEQAAQLGLKGLLHGVGAAAWGHDLEQLAQRARDQGLIMSQEIADAFRRLGRLYIPSRYPDSHAAGDPASHFAASDAEAAMRDAGDVLSWVDECWEELQ